MSSTRETSPEVTNVGNRPYVIQFAKRPDFNVGDKVYLLDSDGVRKGPYEIATPPSAGKCTLSLASGEAVNNGAEVDTNDLEAAGT